MEKERERVKQRTSEKQQEDTRKTIEKPKHSEKQQSSRTEYQSPENEQIMRDYDVEFYMKRGLNKIEAIEYIKNKLSVKKLWSKMSQKQ